MNEFLKLNWRDLITGLEPQDSFINEDTLENSMVYQHFHNKCLFNSGKKKAKTIFQDGSCTYVPGQQFKRVTAIKSVLDKTGQELCLKALKVLQSGKDPSCFTASEQYYVDILKKLKPQILKENLKYQEYVKHQWEVEDQKAVQFIKKQLIYYAQKIWEENWKKIVLYPRYYKEISSFNMSFNENDSVIDFKCVGNVLELGSLAKFSHPNLKSPCCLKVQSLPEPQTTSGSVYSNFPVSLDNNVDKILKENDIDLVISYSGLKCITNTSDIRKRWMIPVNIKNIFIEKKDGTTGEKKVVFVDKPFAKSKISNVDLAYVSYKRLVKTNLCQVEAFKYNCGEDQTLQNDAESEDCDLSKKKHNKKIHYNATYRIWNIKKTDCQNNLMKNKSKTVEFNVLVRSKLDACECNEQGALQPVIVKPKLEMQLNYGANLASKSELAEEWASLFFTPFSNLYRVRLAPSYSEVICIEKCTIQKVISEAQAHFEYKPQLGLGVSQKVFEELLQLNPGQYLLQHLPKHEAFVSILRATDQSDPEVFDFHSEFDKISVDEFPKNWLPIDVNFTLPTFEAINRMPGMFTPKCFKKGGKKIKKKATKKS